LVKTYKKQRKSMDFKDFTKSANTSGHFWRFQNPLGLVGGNSPSCNPGGPRGALGFQAAPGGLHQVSKSANFPKRTCVIFGIHWQLCDETIVLDVTGCGIIIHMLELFGTDGNLTPFIFIYSMHKVWIPALLHVITYLWNSKMKLHCLFRIRHH